MKMVIRRVFLLIALAQLWAACSEDFDPASLINDLRVMAIRTTPPQVGFGVSSVVEALTYSPSTDINYEWSVCLVGIDTAQGFLCADPALECPLGAEPTAELNPAALATECLGNADIPASFWEAAGLDGASPQDLLAWFDESRTVTIKLEVAAAGEKKVDAIKRLVVGGKPPFNQNPALTLVEAKGDGWLAETSLQAKSGEELEIRLDVSPASREAYIDTNDQEATEEMLYAFFATDGEFNGNFADDTRRAQKWKAPKIAANDSPIQVRFWFVVWDGRGGVDWTSRALRILPDGEGPQ